jgi:alanine dehydrogenase
VTLLLRDRDVRSLVSFPEAVEVVARGVVDAASDATAERSTARFGAGWLRIMSGTLPGEGLLGFKAFHLIPGAGVRYLISLYRLSDGEPLALIDGNYVTVARTSAAAAAAAARFFGDQELTLGIVGSGTLARDGLRALASVCRIRSARVYSRAAENRERYASELAGELGIELEGAESPGAAAAGADMVLCATQTHGVVALNAEDVPETARYVSSVSSTLPAQRELDERAIAAAGTVVIDTPDALEESGDLLAAAEAGLDRERVLLLADHLAGSGPPAATPVVYKSIGSVEQDLALAGAVLREAERRGAGQRIDPIVAPR